MRIVCVGGGPGGLYLAILLKKARPEFDIEVVERNAAGVTFGWGVVFSDETLSNFLETDERTHHAIRDRFAHWTAIDVHYRGELLRSEGHGFSGIARKDLLDILVTRAKELGVRIRFETEVEDLSQFADADLIVASDGINSKIRKRYEDVFRPSLDPRKSRFIWLGTKKTFDAFTFVFDKGPRGVFQVHAYKFDATTSTFIVETDEESFRRAGFHEMPVEQSVAELERMFANVLGGEKLLLNKSNWVQFTTVKNASWHCAPETIDGAPTQATIVLLGDAAHTAHFSIGSGTKLAMEAAIALAQSLTGVPDKLPKAATRAAIGSAIAAYEKDRMDIVARIQKAAQDSLSWFEHTKRYVEFEPLQFAFSLLSRSKKIGYENLRLRDPQFMQAVTQDFDAKAGVPVSGGEPPVPPMFTPYRLRDLVLKNRVVVSPMCMYSAKNGVPNDFHLVHLGARAMGGAGLVITEMTDISADGRITPGCAGIYNDEQVTAWRRITDYVHQWSTAAICIQLGHAGRKGATKILWEGMDQPLTEDAWPIYAASPIPYLPHSQVPIEMKRSDMDRVLEDYIQAAMRAERAGFDMIELHAAHGYLLATFLSPLTNKRTDEYGGSSENRIRFPLEVARALRATWPAERPMSVRISACDWAEDGITEEDAKLFCVELKKAGIDIVDVSTGQTIKGQKPVYGRMWQTPFSDMIRNDVGIPTMTVGNISSADQVNTILVAGRADLCVLARPHLLNPNWTMAAAQEQGFWDMEWPNQYMAVKGLPVAKT